jgi:uncharacterized protein YdhG (YjbR/CyaY superfamily)
MQLLNANSKFGCLFLKTARANRRFYTEIVQSSAKTVSEYIKSLPPERALVIKQIRKLVKQNLPDGFKECMRWGMISWEVPLSRYPVTYNGQPLSYIALAAQKNNYSLYLMGCYADEKNRAAFEKSFKQAGKKLDAGKSCVRFKKVEDLPLDLIAKQVCLYSVEDYIKLYEKSRKLTKQSTTVKK